MDFLDHFQKVLVKYFYNEPQILKWHHRRDSDIKGMGGAVRSSYQSNVRKYVSNHYTGDFNQLSHSKFRINSKISLKFTDADIFMVLLVCWEF